jgi:ribose 5-phosphate isomerase A
MKDDPEALKRAAARQALALVEDGMRLGLGSGSTAELFLELLAERVKDGLRVIGVPTSERVAGLARGLGIPLVEGHDDLTRLDLAVDGADEIEPRSLALIKGRGGALLREKLVATAADRLCVIADGSKLVRALGQQAPVPVAVLPFGWRQTAERIAHLGTEPVLRRVRDRPLVTDDGLYILDCRWSPIADPAALDAALKRTLGVAEHGIFLGMTWRALVAAPDGVTVLEAGKVTA